MNEFSNVFTGSVLLKHAGAILRIGCGDPSRTFKYMIPGRNEKLSIHDLVKGNRGDWLLRPIRVDSTDSANFYAITGEEGFEINEHVKKVANICSNTTATSAKEFLEETKFKSILDVRRVLGGKGEDSMRGLLSRATKVKMHVDRAKNLAAALDNVTSPAPAAKRRRLDYS
mgnify:CR=1 FL=1